MKVVVVDVAALESSPTGKFHPGCVGEIVGDKLSEHGCERHQIGVLQIGSSRVNSGGDVSGTRQNGLWQRNTVLVFGWKRSSVSLECSAPRGMQRVVAPSGVSSVAIVDVVFAFDTAFRVGAGSVAGTYEGPY